MADNTVEKIKEQCLELILHVMPLSQVAFVFVMAVILNRIGSAGAVSPILALNHLGLSSLFGLEDGLFWKVDVLVLGASFFLALFNTAVIKRGLRRSFGSSGLSTQLGKWVAAASAVVSELANDERVAIQKSVATELEKRIKKYHAKRLLAESMCSIASCIIFASLYFVVLHYRNLSVLEWSLPDAGVFTLSLFAWILLHRNSVQYAISKVIPLQVYLSASTGEIAFFVDAE